MFNLEMTYEEAKILKQKLEDKNRVDSDKLNTFEKNAMRITPDHIRALPEWKQAKNEFDRSFAELRNFNEWFIKKFKKEYAAERKYKRKLNQ